LETFVNHCCLQQTYRLFFVCYRCSFGVISCYFNISLSTRQQYCNSSMAY